MENGMLNGIREKLRHMFASGISDGTEDRQDGDDQTVATVPYTEEMLDQMDAMIQELEQERDWLLTECNNCRFLLIEKNKRSGYSNR